MGAHRQGDMWGVHCRHTGSLVSGSSTVYANNRQLGRHGDPVSCGSKCASGSNNVFAGG